MARKRDAVQTGCCRETEASLNRSAQRLDRGEAPAAGWIEQTLRAALLEDGRRLLEGLLAQVPAPAAPRVPGQRRYPDRRGKVLSVFGPITLARDYHHPPGPEGGFPLDRVLGLPGRTAAHLLHGESCQQLAELAV